MLHSRLCRVLVLVASLAMSLGGCRYYWFKPGSTAEMFTGDSDSCLQEGRSASPATQRYGIVNQDVYRACLQSRGYERQKTVSGPEKHRGVEFDD
jgi:hypothetical protein